jgi:SOS-response transcriptional repressor LexA
MKNWQRRMLRAIWDHIAEHGYPPLYSEIQGRLMLSSTSVVAYRLKVLEREGYIQRKPKAAARSIQLTDKARALFAPLEPLNIK